MASRRGSADKFTPIRGLITEGNKGQFPQDSAIDLSNVDILPEGIVQRRLGANIEAGGQVHFTTTNSNRVSGAMSQYLWKNANGVPNLNLRLIQIGNEIKVFEDKTPLSQQTILRTINLASAARRAEYVEVGKALVVTNGASDPIVITISGTEGSVSVASETLSILVRVDYRLHNSPPGVVGTSQFLPSVTEEFDLRNSGWPFDRLCATREDGDSDPRWNDPAGFFRQVIGYWPGISLNPKYMILDTAEDPDSVGTFSPRKVNEDAFFGNSVPPLGHYITSAWSIDARQLMLADLKSPTPSEFRNPISQINPLLTSETVKSSGTFQNATSNRPTCVGYINGHALFGGLDLFNKPTLWVSQLVKTTDNIGRCYQEADPTADEINDLVATDGGVLHPVGMSTPIAIREFNNGAIIFAQNGVWHLSGSGTGEAFSMTSFRFTRITSINAVSAGSILEVEGAILYWSEEGIIQIATNQFGEANAENLTKNTINKFYNAIGDRALPNINGVYASAEKRVYWFVPDSRQESGYFRSDTQLVVVLDLRLPGFYIYNLAVSTDAAVPRAVLPLELEGTVKQNTIVNVVDSAFNNVVTSTGDNVVANGTVTVDNDLNLGIVTMRVLPEVSTPSAVEYSTLSSTTFADWDYYSSIPYQSFIEFAYLYPSNKTAGMQVPYLHSFFAKEREIIAAPNTVSYYDPSDPLPGVCIVGAFSNTEDGMGNLNPSSQWLFNGLTLPGTLNSMTHVIQESKIVVTTLGVDQTDGGGTPFTRYPVIRVYDVAALTTPPQSIILNDPAPFSESDPSGFFPFSGMPQSPGDRETQLPCGLTFSNDGMYAAMLLFIVSSVTGELEGRLLTYSMSSPYDVFTLSLVSQSILVDDPGNLMPEEPTLQQLGPEVTLQFSTDGTKLFISGVNSYVLAGITPSPGSLGVQRARRIYKVDLDPGYTLPNAGLVGTTLYLLPDLLGADQLFDSFAFSTDGTELYTTKTLGNGPATYRFSLPIPWVPENMTIIDTIGRAYGVGLGSRFTSNLAADNTYIYSRQLNAGAADWTNENTTDQTTTFTTTAFYTGCDE